MKSLLLSLSFFSSIVFSSELSADFGKSNNPEDVAFWKRLLAHESSLSIVEEPTSSPVKSPIQGPIVKVPVEPPSVKLPVSPPTKTPVSIPKNAPVVKPSKAPVSAPIPTPVFQPTDFPISSPTDLPVFPPSDSPVSQPTNSPESSPTDSPQSQPTKSPVASPTDSPVNPPNPTDSPVTSPTDTPVTPTDSPVTSPTDTPVTPTDSPVTSPTDSPITPTDSPVTSPTDSPITPTDSPVSSPTTSPVSQPTDIPLPPPVFISPSIAPINGPRPCFVDVELTCETSVGLPCDDIPPPPTECNDDVNLVALTFQVLNYTCSQSANSQGDNAFCRDFDVSLAETADVECLDDKNSKLKVTPTSVSIGNFFTVSNPNGGKLSSKTDCTLLNENNVKIQQNVIDTSGESIMSSGDRFGALTLATCGPTDCFETIVYTIDVINLDADPISLTLLDFTFQNDTVSLLDDVEPNPIPGNDIVTLETEYDINICFAGQYFAGVVTRASLGNAVCQASATDEFACPVCKDPL